MDNGRDDETCEGCGSFVDWRGDWEPGLLCDDCKVESLELKITSLESDNKALQARVEKLERRLTVAANQLEGVSVAIQKHGQNIDVEFFIETYAKFADDLRRSLKDVSYG